MKIERVKIKNKMRNSRDDLGRSLRILGKNVLETLKYLLTSLLYLLQVLGLLLILLWIDFSDAIKKKDGRIKKTPKSASLGREEIIMERVHVKR